MHQLKTGALITAAVACGARVAQVPEAELDGYRRFAAELGLLFQIVDDILDDGSPDEPSYVNTLGIDEARRLAGESRSAELLAALPGDTGELAELTELIAVRDR